MLVEQLARYYTPPLTADELWHLVEAEWASVPALVFQSVYKSKTRLTAAYTL